MKKSKTNPQVDVPLIASQTALKSKRGSTGNYEYGGSGHTSRKRRLMLLDDAACSSINFNRHGSAEFGSAHRNSAGPNHSSQDNKQIQYYSLGSMGDSLKHDSVKNQSELGAGEKVGVEGEYYPPNDDEVEMGAGQIDADEEIDI